MKRRVLFVDDEANILDGLRNTFRRQRGDWDMAFALGGPAALCEMEKAPFDVIVADMRMAGMGGAELLRRVKEAYPGTARFVLSGHADQDAIVSVLPFAHQYLSKPCRAEDLQIAIERVCAIQALVHDDTIRRVIGGLDKLPSVPQAYWDLTHAVADPGSGMDEIVSIIQRDPAMSLKILQLANSAYFGLARKVSSIEMAVAHLGAQVLKALALNAGVFSTIEIPEIEGFSLDRLQAGALLRARLAKRFMRDRKHGEEAFTAAMIHDIGTLIVALVMPEVFTEIRRNARETARPIHVVERERLGVTHAEIGAYLQGMWGLPYPIVQAVAYHHNPSSAPCGEAEVLAALHVADALADPGDLEQSTGSEGLDLGFLDRAGLISQLGGWRTMAANEMGSAQLTL
jgi:HD-like signal output (HDOD) protein